MAARTLADLRATARARLDEQPSSKSEDWRYVDLKPLDPSTAGGDVERPAPDLLADLPGLALGPEGPRPLGTLPTGCTLTDLRDEDSVDPDWADAVLAGDLQAAWSLSGAVSELRLRGTQGPLLILDNGGHNRLRIDIAPGAAVDLIIVHQLRADERACLGLDLAIGADAAVRIDEIETGCITAQLLTHRLVRVARSASCVWTQAGIGGELIRHSWVVDLLETGAEARLSGATVIDDDRQLHQHIRMHHRAAHTVSDQCFRCVADGHSRSSFDGLVHVAPHCPESHAEQSAGNLQLGAKARIFARPQLDVHTDDVHATHGATIGQPDADEQFYLRSRGIPKALATQLVIRGFIDDIVHRFHSPVLKDAASRHASLMDWLQELA